MVTLEYIILAVLVVGFGWLFYKNRGNNTGSRNLPKDDTGSNQEK